MCLLRKNSESGLLKKYRDLTLTTNNNDNKVEEMKKLGRELNDTIREVL